MRRYGGPAAAGIWVAAMLHVVVALPAAASRAVGARAELAAINQRWQGAECRMRVPIEVKKGRDRHGWSEGHWLCHHGGGSKADNFCFRVRVSDRDALRRWLNGKVLEPGVRVVSDGWSFDDPENAKGLVLHFRFLDPPVKMQWHFTGPHMGTASKVSAEEIRYMEHYARLTAFHVSPVEERLVAVAAPTPAPTFPPPPVQLRPVLDIQAVAVEPPRITPGEELQLVIIYAVGGVPSGQSLPVREERTILQAGAVLTALEARIERGAGVHQSSQALRVPHTLPAGVYEIQVLIEALGAASRGSAMFQVQAHDR